MIALQGEEDGMLPDMYACGSCFQVVDEDDAYCRACGIELDTEDCAYSYEELKEYNEKNKK